MKLNVLFASLFVVCAMGSMMGMKNDKSRLNFLVNHLRCIETYSAQNMEFAVQPEKFLGKNILDVVPLNDHDRNALNNGFDEAVQKEITVRVPYTLEDAYFVAKITPLIKVDKENNFFFIKVQELDAQNNQ